MAVNICSLLINLSLNVTTGVIQSPFLLLSRTRSVPICTFVLFTPFFYSSTFFILVFPMIFSSKKLPNYEILNNPKNSCKKVLCKFGATCLKKLDLLTHVGGIYAHEIEGHSELVCACRFNCSKQIDHPGRVESYEWLVKKLHYRPYIYLETTR